jgi:hypothetical protein
MEAGRRYSPWIDPQGRFRPQFSSAHASAPAPRTGPMPRANRDRKRVVPRAREQGLSDSREGRHGVLRKERSNQYIFQRFMALKVEGLERSDGRRASPTSFSTVLIICLNQTYICWCLIKVKRLDKQHGPRYSRIGRDSCPLTCAWFIPAYFLRTDFF